MDSKLPGSGAVVRLSSTGNGTGEGEGGATGLTGEAGDRAASSCGTSRRHVREAESS